MDDLRFRVWDGSEMHEPPHDFKINSDGSLYLPMTHRITGSLAEYEGMFYTGLTDAEGTPIYEGDVLKWGLEDNVGAVVWSGQRLQWEVQPIAVDLAQIDWLLVIGNRYEDPDLLDN